MTLVSIAAPTKAGDEAETGAAQGLEELVAEFGPRAVVGAILGSSIAEAMERVGGGEAALRVSQVIVREIAFSKNPQLEAEIIALATGVLLMDEDNMTKTARRWGLTRGAISKRVLKFVDENKLPPSVFMRKEADRLKYALTNRPRVT